MKKASIWILTVCLVLSALVFTSCESKPVYDGLTKAADYIQTMYKDAKEVTAADYQRVSVVIVDGVSYKVQWSVDVADGVKIEDDGKLATIDVNETTDKDIKYVLKAVISDDKDNKKELTFNHMIPAFKELSFDEFLAAQSDDTVIVKGVISGIIAKSKGNSNNCLYVQDEKEGGYYVYGLTSDPVTDLALETGMTVRVTGKKSVYNGTLEVVSATVEVLSKDKKDITPLDVTELYKKAENLKDANLVKNQAMLVTVKGVEIEAETDSDISSGYFRFKLDSKSSYIRISSSVCPLTKDEQTSFKAGHKEHTGYIADVTGVICVYDGAFYLTPVTADAINYIGLPEKSSAEKVAFEKANLTLTDNIAAAGSVELPSTGKTYTDVKIEWTSDNAVAKVADGKLTVAALPETETKVKVTAVLTLGTEKETVEFTVSIDANVTVTYTVEKVTDPKTDTAYVFGIGQKNLGQDLYFTGSMSGNYLATTDKVAKAATVFLEADGANYRLYFMKDGAKTYVEIYEYTAGKAGIQIVTTPSMSYTWNAEMGILIANVAGSDRYLGAYNNYNTLSASATSYITGSNAANVGVTQFPAYLFTATAK